jgi:hypothetical protein
MCFQSAIELYGIEEAKKLAHTTLEKYAHDRFVREFDEIPTEKRWPMFRDETIKYADGIQYSIAEHDENMVQIKCTFCTFLEVFKKYGLEDFVPIYCATDYSVCKAIHPDIKMTRTQTLADGADYCDHCWTFKGEK